MNIREVVLTLQFFFFFKYMRKKSKYIKKERCHSYIQHYLKKDSCFSLFTRSSHSNSSKRENSELEKVSPTPPFMNLMMKMDGSSYCIKDGRFNYILVVTFCLLSVLTRKKYIQYDINLLLGLIINDKIMQINRKKF